MKTAIEERNRFVLYTSSVSRVFFKVTLRFTGEFMNSFIPHSTEQVPDERNNTCSPRAKASSGEEYE